MAMLPGRWCVWDGVVQYLGGGGRVTRCYRWGERLPFLHSDENLRTSQKQKKIANKVLVVMSSAVLG